MFFRPITWIAIGLFLHLQGIIFQSSGAWINLWPVATYEEGDCDRCFSRETYFGPLIEQRYTECGHVAAIRPLAGHIDDYDCCESLDYFLYPLFTHLRTQWGSSWNIFGLISNCSTPDKEKFSFFPFLFFNHSCNPCDSYYGIFPIVGKVRNYLCADSLRWFLFPLYLGIQKGDTVRHGLPWPIIRWQTGPCSGGGALWPLVGCYWRENDYYHSYAFWPIAYKFLDALGTPYPSIRRGLIPLYAYENSARREMTTVLWPFISRVEMHDRCYVENQFFWPFFVQGRGENEYVNRWAPIYTHSYRCGRDKRWFLWPLIKIQHWEDRGLYVTQEQFFYFIFWKQCQQCLADPSLPPAKKVHLWPLLSYWDNGVGQRQFQFISPIEVFFPNSKAVRIIYSPLFAIFRYEQIAPGHTRQSLLFDLIATEKTPCSQRLSVGPLLDVERGPCGSGFQILKGLLGFKIEENKKCFKFLWISF